MIEANKTYRWAFWGIAALVTGFLCFHSAPGLGFHDSGEFALAAAEGGLPHPPGAPTWTLLGYLATKVLFFCSEIQATNLLSTICGAATLVIMALLAIQLMRDQDPSASTALPYACGWAIMAFLLWSPAFQLNCATTEQYTLQLLLIAAHFYLLYQITRNPRDTANKRETRNWVCLGLLLGLNIGNHLNMLTLGLGVVLVLGYRYGRNGKQLLQKGGSAALGGILGLSVFV